MEDTKQEHEQIEGIKDGQEVPLSDNIEITELHCHNCDGYIKFALDKGKNGLHVVLCPKCGHEHCRIIKDGVVTGDRWDSRNALDQQGQITSSTNTWTVTVSMDNYSTQGWQVIDDKGTLGCQGSIDPYLNDSWGNTIEVTNDISSGTYYTYTSSPADCTFTIGTFA